MVRALIFFNLFFIFFYTLQAQTHKIGDTFGGGIVFSISSDGKHGLIVETIDQSKSCNFEDALIAIKDKNNHSEEGKKFDDWRMPKIDEMLQLYINLRVKNKCSNLIKLCFDSDYYWSSSKYIYTDPDTGDLGYDYAWFLKFSNGEKDWTAMGNSVAVRAIREF